MSERLTDEEVAELDIELFLQDEGIAHKVGRGSSGIQAQIQTCPDCGDSRWRCYFGLDNGWGNCFVCGKGFSRLTFVHAALGHDDTEWRKTFDRVREMLKAQGWRPKRQAMVAVDIGTVTLPISTPVSNETPEARDYLAQRSIPLDVATYFQLRHCKHGWWMFKEGEETKMQNFQDRIIVPVFDLDGQLKTFQGRDMLGFSDRKYLFPVSLPGTGRYLLNGHNCILSKHACMGEGIFDVVAIKMALDEEPDLRDVTALGSFGKHLSYGDQACNDQLGRFMLLKKRGLETVTIMWDGEPKALVAALDAAKKLVAIGIVVRIAFLPPGRDPNEVTPDVVRAAYRGAQLWTPALDMMLRLQNPYAESAGKALQRRYGII